MKDLIDNLVTMFETAITNAEITKAVSVWKGLKNDPSEIPTDRFGYIAVDDGGEDLERNDSNDAQTRWYIVILEMAVQSMKIETALDDILDLVDEVKTVLEKESNRQKDGYEWGVDIQPFDWENKSMKRFFRGRQVVVRWRQLEDRTPDY